MSTIEKKQVTVLPFEVEADSPKNSDLFIQTIGVRLRSRIKQTVEVFDRDEGERSISETTAKLINGLPRKIPGMHLRVDPAKCIYEVSDPLTDDPETLDKIRKAMIRQAGFSSNGKLKGVKATDGKMHRDEMKTLLREMLGFIRMKKMRVVAGKAPTMEDVEGMPGEFLTNARNLGRWKQPRYEKDVEEWSAKVDQLS